MKPMRGKTPKKPPRGKQNGNIEKDPVEVYCRVRPLSDLNDERCLEVISTSTVKMIAPVTSAGGKNGVKETHYTFTYVFDEYTTQKAIFDHSGLPLVEDLVGGKNALLFAYGVTSSGKTHTMNGTPQDQGILPRCLDVLFNSIGPLQARKYVFKPDKMNGFDVQSEVDAMAERQQRDIMQRAINTPKTPGTPREKFDPSQVPRVRDPSIVINVEEDNNYAVFVSYIEIYNNYVFDLLEELPYDTITGYKAPQSKILREDGNRNMYVSGVVEVEVKSTEEAYDVLWKGQRRRKVAHTALNAESSRSHSVFNIRLVQAPLDPVGKEVFQDKEHMIVSQLSLVDLAGSERSNRTNSTGDRIKEAGNINQSLMVLRTCIEYLRENQQTGGSKMVPYRDSRLTHLFKNYFDGEGKVRMVVCCNPKAEEYDETVNVMKFAEMTQEVQIARSQQVRFDVGFTPGRRRRNQEYKEALAKAYESGELPDQMPEAIVYSLGPPFPMLELKQPHDEYMLSSLMEYLKSREAKRLVLISDLETRHEAFRKRLLEVERENETLKRKLDDICGGREDLETELARAQKRIRLLERDKDMLSRTTSAYESERRDMEREIFEKERQLMAEQAMKDRIAQDYHAKLVLTEAQYSKQMESQRRRIKEESEAALKARDKRFQMLKHIINKDDDTMSVTSSASSEPPKTPAKPTPVTRHARAATIASRMPSATSEPDLTISGTDRKPHYRAMTAAAANRVATNTRRKSPPPVKPKPAIHQRYHRRSKSSGEIWLDHRTQPDIDTGALLKPSMKKRKSASKLNEKDLKKTSHYLLTHQGLDSDGDFSTKFVKGTAHPTIGGGTAVVFHDVEQHKHKSPGDLLEHPPQARPEDFEGEWTDTEDRCKTAVEHHGQIYHPPETQF